MANKYFDKMNHISRDSHVRLCPASHENPEQSIVIFKVRTTVIPSTCLFVYGLVFHHLEKPTLIRTKLDNLFDIHSHPVHPFSHIVMQDIQLYHPWSRTGHVDRKER